MIRAGVGISRAPEACAAARESAESALAGCGSADAALVFASGHSAAAPSLLAAVAEVLETEVLAGASAHGVLGAGCEHEGVPAVSVLAWSGVEAHPFVLPDLRGHEASAGREIAEHLDGGPRPEDLVVLFPDPRSVRGDPLMEGLAALAPAQVVGAGAADPTSETALQWCGRRVECGAISGMALRGRQPARVGVTQACRPATDLLCVTRTRGNWILELDGRPALDVFREVAREPLADDLARAAAFVLVALPRDGDEPLRPGSYVVRNAVGFATEKGAFAVAEAVSPGTRLALAVREPEAAREDLKAMLANHREPAPAFGLYLDCCARGAGFFGVPGLEAAYLEHAFGPAPVAGMFGSCEIGPIGSAAPAPELLTYTGVLALIDD